MLNLSDLEDDLRQLAEHYVGGLDVWEFTKEGKDYHMVCIPQDPTTLKDAYSFKAINRMLDFIRMGYPHEIKWANYVSSATMETTDLPYFYIKLEGYTT